MENEIQCPQCGHSFDVEEALRVKVEARVNQEQKDNFKKAIAEAVAAERQRAQTENEKKTQKKLQFLQKENQERLDELQLLQQQANKTLAENKELKKKELEILRKENVMKEREEEFRLNTEKEFLQKQSEIEEKAKARELEKFEMERTQMQKKLNDALKAAEDLKRKAEQGSMQLQGEAQELALEELLHSAYPYDNIDEIKKGAHGADCVQSVLNSLQQKCGVIVYESKRTKNFSNDWISKLKENLLRHKGDIAVLVTEVLPAGMLRFGEKDGVWICGFHEVESLSAALRQILLKAQSVKIAQENQGEKSAALYKYLTGSEFVQIIRTLVENYDAMKTQIEKEKKAMLKLWKEREKQVEKSQEGLISIFGSIKGIAGRELLNGGFLELEESLEKEEDGASSKS